MVPRRIYWFKENTTTKWPTQIDITSSEVETASLRTVCSYVQIMSDSMKLGRILQISDHKFAGTVY